MILLKTIPFIQGVLTLFLLILVFRQRKQNTETRLFSLFLVSMSLWGFLIGVMRNTSDLAIATWWERAAMASVALTSVFFFFFTLSYIKSRSRTIVYLAVIYILFTALIFPTNLFVSGMGVDNYGNAPKYGLVFYPWLLIIYLLIVVASINLNRARKSSDSYEVRNRYTFMIIGASLCLLGGLLDVLPVLGVPVIPGSIIGNILFALLTTFAILRFHLFDIRVVLRSGLAYIVTGFLVAIPTIGIGIIWAYFTRKLDLTIWAAVLPPALLILVVPPLWVRAEAIVTRRIRSEKYAYLKALEQFSHSKVSVSKLDELSNLIIRLVDGAIHPVSLFLFVQREDGCFELVGSKGAEKDSSLLFTSEHPLVQLFQHRREMIWGRQFNVFPELQAISTQESVVINQIKGELYFPIGVGELSGILALGAKPSTQIYSREDLEFLNTFLRQVGLELENIHLFNQEKAQRERVEQFNAERATFLDALAHEMKTPLTSAVSSSELLVNELHDKPGNAQLLAVDVQGAIDNLGRIVNDILEFGRLQKIKIKCVIQTVDINDAILKVKEESNLLLLRKQQALILEIPEGAILVKADVARVKQVLHNLISNASKFSPVNREIKLKVKILDQYVHVEVYDCAEKIAAEDRGHLFTAYYRGTQARDKHLPGLGLGLYICKELIEGQKGRIWIEDNRGAGNIFCFSLPREEQKSNENIDNRR
jgi:signal transduction histidine kinase